MSRACQLWKWYIWVGIVMPLTILLLFLVMPSSIMVAPSYWINHMRQVPPIPFRSTRYTIRDAGIVNADEVMRTVPFQPQFVLGEGGTVRPSTEDDFPSDAEFAARDRVQKELGLSDVLIRSRSSNGYVLIDGHSQYLMYHGAKLIGIMHPGALGYHWNTYGWLPMLKVNRDGVAIGNTDILTAQHRTCGNAPDEGGHGRSLPLIWRGGNSQPTDLNCQIAANSGWYLDRALDINARGQILCAAQQTDAKGAEEFEEVPYHLVVLTPMGDSGAR